MLSKTGPSNYLIFVINQISSDLMQVNILLCSQKPSNLFVDKLFDVRVMIEYFICSYFPRSQNCTSFVVQECTIHASWFVVSLFPCNASSWTSGSY